MDKSLSKSLKRSVKAISWQAYKLKLKKDYNFYCKSKKKYKKGFTKEIFEDLYIVKKRSIREIAKMLNLGKNTIDYYLKKFNIPKRTRSEASKLGMIKYSNWRKGLTKEKDKRLVIIAKKAKKTLAKKRRERLKKIEERWGKPIKEIINELYWNQNLTQQKIAKQIGLSRDLIIHLMKKLNISKRPNYEYISGLKGQNHPMYGKKWEEVYSTKEAKKKETNVSNIASQYYQKIEES